MNPLRDEVIKKIESEAEQYVTTNISYSGLEYSLGGMVHKDCVLSAKGYATIWAERAERLRKVLEHYSCSYEQIILTGPEHALEALAAYESELHGK